MSAFPFPQFPLEISKDGGFVHPEQVRNIVNALSTASNSITDLLVMSHGWNNDESDAQTLYNLFFNQVDTVLGRHMDLGLKPEQFGVVTVFWPSKKFADRDLIPGNAAGLGDLEDEADDAIDDAFDRLKDLLDDDDAGLILEAARAQKHQLDDPAVQDSFVNLLKSALPRREPPSVDVVEGAHEFLAASGREMFQNLDKPIIEFTPPSTDEGGAASFDPDARRSDNTEGEAAGLGDVLGGIKGAVLKILNYTTYYAMKERAATVGRLALNGALRTIQQSAPGIRLHLIGHSFGGRVVTAAAQGPQAIQLSSMTLLEAAFSHYAFSARYDENPAHVGFFRDVITNHRVMGPLLISHSKLDTAVGIAYAIASRIAGQIGAALGDANDPFGGLGRNGAQKTEGAQDLQLLEESQPYPFTKGGIFNLNGDTIIKSHSDIAEPQVAYALLCGLSFAAGASSASVAGT